MLVVRYVLIIMHQTKNTNKKIKSECISNVNRMWILNMSKINDAKKRKINMINEHRVRNCKIMR